MELGDIIGACGKAMSESNGIWEQEYLHFAIYRGPFHGRVLPGYYNEQEEKTRPEDWTDPMEFVKNYNLCTRRG